MVAGIRSLLVLSAFFLLISCAAPQKTVIATRPYSENGSAIWHKFVPLEEGKLYTSKEPSKEFIEWLVKEKGVKTFVSLRGRISREKEELINRLGAKIIIFRWSAHRLPPEEEINEVLRIMGAASAENPTQIFCTAGADRTGFVRAYWRLFRQGWTKEEAFSEFKYFGHIKKNILDEYLEKKFLEKTETAR